MRMLSHILILHEQQAEHVQILGLKRYRFHVLYRDVPVMVNIVSGCTSFNSKFTHICQLWKINTDKTKTSASTDQITYLPSIPTSLKVS